jgi:hypothetical protein
MTSPVETNKRRNFSVFQIVSDVFKQKKYSDMEFEDEKRNLELKCEKDKINPSNPNSALVIGYNSEEIHEIIKEIKNCYENFTENELLSFKDQIHQNILFTFKTILKKIEFEKIDLDSGKSMEILEEKTTLTNIDTTLLTKLFSFEEFQKTYKENKMKEECLNNLE